MLTPYDEVIVKCLIKPCLTALWLPTDADLLPLLTLQNLLQQTPPCLVHIFSSVQKEHVNYQFKTVHGTTSLSPQKLRICGLESCMLLRKSTLMKTGGKMAFCKFALSEPQPI